MNLSHKCGCDICPRVKLRVRLRVELTVRVGTSAQSWGGKHSKGGVVFQRNCFCILRVKWSRVGVWTG